MFLQANILYTICNKYLYPIIIVLLSTNFARDRCPTFMGQSSCILLCYRCFIIVVYLYTHFTQELLPNLCDRRINFYCLDPIQIPGFRVWHTVKGGGVTCPCWADATVGYVCVRSIPRASSYGRYNNLVSGRHRIISSDQHLVVMTTINSSQTVALNRVLLTMIPSIDSMFYRQLPNVPHAQLSK